MLKVWETASHYHLCHAVALLGAGVQLTAKWGLVVRACLDVCDPEYRLCDWARSFSLRYWWQVWV